MDDVTCDVIGCQFEGHTGVNEPGSRLVFWNPPQGSRSQASKGIPRLTYPKLLSQDTTGIPQQGLLNLMKDRVQWRKFIMASDRGRQK